MVPRDVLHTILCFCEEANTPRSLTASLLLKSGEVGQLLDLRAVPAHHANARSYFRDALITELLRKCKGVTDDGSLRAAAIASFHESEKACYRSNERLTPYLFNVHVDRNSGRISEVFSLARKYLAYILGACPDLPPGRFGPGATFADRGKYSTVPDKMSSSPTLTAAAMSCIPTWSKTAWGRAVASHRGSIDLVRGNRFTTVPKDSRKDRGIAVEPSINVFFQLAYGKVMRQRLRMKLNVDLDLRADVHRKVARQASIDGSLCTIDLSSASDTVCSNLVKLLLPPSWYAVLNDLRSPMTFLDGHWYRLEKFSSMGNGFTFELETLLFQSLCFAVLALGGYLPDEQRNLFVFGDDIIVPTGSAPDVLAILSFCGFSANVNKTFVEGPFRESCGGDFFDGTPVRAYYLKEFPCEPHQWVAHANGLRRVIYDHTSGLTDISLTSPSWRLILDQVPSEIRSLTGPDSLGDIVVNTCESLWRPCSLGSRNGRSRSLGSYSPRLGDGIRYFKTWSPVRYHRVGWQHFRSDVVLASALYGSGDGFLGVTPRDSVAGYGMRWVPSS